MLVLAARRVLQILRIHNVAELEVRRRDVLLLVVTDACRDDLLARHAFPVPAPSGVHRVLRRQHDVGRLHDHLQLVANPAAQRAHPLCLQLRRLFLLPRNRLVRHVDSLTQAAFLPYQPVAQLAGLLPCLFERRALLHTGDKRRGDGFCPLGFGCRIRAFFVVLVVRVGLLRRLGLLLERRNTLLLRRSLHGVGRRLRITQRRVAVVVGGRRIRPLLQQQLHNPVVAPVRRPVQRRRPRATRRVLRRHVCCHLVQQPLRHRSVPEPTRHVQQRRSALADFVHVRLRHPRRLLLRQRAVEGSGEGCSGRRRRRGGTLGSFLGRDESQLLSSLEHLGHREVMMHTHLLEGRENNLLPVSLRVEEHANTHERARRLHDDAVVADETFDAKGALVIKPFKKPLVKHLTCVLDLLKLQRIQERLPARRRQLGGGRILDPSQERQHLLQHTHHRVLCLRMRIRVQVVDVRLLPERVPVHAEVRGNPLEVPAGAVLSSAGGELGLLGRRSTLVNAAVQGRVDEVHHLPVAVRVPVRRGPERLQRAVELLRQRRVHSSVVDAHEP
eukprot:Rhum_TRINITY_DN15483_c3_g1::Rhum_TRINITY_DN15483_c3_g1_i15::g.159945::m.159945